jgi:hypothetical protein
VRLSPILVDLAWHPHHVPDAALAVHPSIQHRRQLPHIESIRLRAAGSPVHLNTRRVDDAIAHAERREIPVDPEPVPPRFITALHGRIGRQAEAVLGGGNFVAHVAPVGRAQAALAQGGAWSRRESH